MPHEGVASELAHQVIFVDANVQDQPALLANIFPVIEIVYLTADRPALVMMAEALANQNGVPAIHLISHDNARTLSQEGGMLTNASSAEAANANVTNVTGTAMFGGNGVLAAATDSMEAGVAIDALTQAQCQKSQEIPLKMSGNLSGLDGSGNIITFRTGYGSGGDVISKFNADGTLLWQKPVTFSGSAAQFHQFSFQRVIYNQMLKNIMSFIRSESIREKSLEH